MLVETLDRPQRTRSRKPAYTNADLGRYLEAATNHLMRDIRAIELAEKENWAKVRRGEIP